VRDFIDGTDPVTAHGSREMPVWGYPLILHQVRREEFSLPELAQEEIDNRIKLLVEYMKSIQKK